MIKLTKTKRQLRAEAVERLRNTKYDGTYMMVAAMLGWPENGKVYDGEAKKSALIDLLTDDELPEGDAVGLLRDFPRTHTVGCASTDVCKAREVRDIEDLYAIADMVERDYVRRDIYDHHLGLTESDIRRFKSECDELKAERDKWREAAGNTHDMREEATTERDEWKAKYDKLLSGSRKIVRDYNEEFDLLRAERDEWKAKAHAAPQATGIDGRPVLVGQQMTDGTRTATCMGIGDGDVFFREGGRIKCNRAKGWKTVLAGGDGRPVEAGQHVYGADGRRWRVTGIRWGSSHPVQVVGKNGLRRDLKPEWCAHERPDSAERIAEELREFVDEHLVPLGNGQYKEYGELNELAERIEKLGGKK